MPRDSLRLFAVKDPLDKQSATAIPSAVDPPIGERAGRDGLLGHESVSQVPGVFSALWRPGQTASPRSRPGKRGVSREPHLAEL